MKTRKDQSLSTNLLPELLHILIKSVMRKPHILRPKDREASYKLFGVKQNEVWLKIIRGKAQAEVSEYWPSRSKIKKEPL